MGFIHKPGEPFRDGKTVVAAERKGGKVKYTLRDSTPEDTERWKLENIVDPVARRMRPEEDVLRAYTRLNEIEPGKYAAEVAEYAGRVQATADQRRRKENGEKVNAEYNKLFGEIESAGGNLDAIEAVGADMDQWTQDDWLDQKKISAVMDRLRNLRGK